MSDSPDLTTFRKKLEERRAKEKAKAREAEAAAPAHDDDLVPEEQYERSEEDRAMDQVIENIDILEAYRRWCGKSNPVVKGEQREGIKISCPIPSHPDKNPSAWINLDKQTWFCGACNEGGDSHDIAAYHFGYPVPGYKDGAEFHKLRREMAQDFGFTFTKMPGGAVEVTAPEPKSEPADEEPEPPPSKVVELYNEDDDESILLPTLDWRPIVPRDTFLETYMHQTVIDDAPEEYHFFNALVALGFALGREVRLFDLVPVYANLFVCTLGRSGTGKSKAKSHLDRLLTSALPHNWSDPNSKGVRKISSPGSAEVLIHNFQKPVEDPTNPKKIMYYAPVRGLIDFNELSALVGRASRQGNVTKPVLQEFYDMGEVIATSSMSHGAKEAHQPFASLVTTTQPRSLRTLVEREDIDNGFLNRWVFVPGKEKQRVAIGGVRVDMEPAVKPLQNILGWAGSFRGDEMMQWSQPAAELFTHFFHETIERDKRKAGEDSLLTRMDLLIKKLCLLFTANRKLKEVPEEAVKEAIHCYTYLVESYGIPTDQIGSTLQQQIRDDVLRVARKAFDNGQRAVTMREIGRSLQRKKYSPKQLVDMCDYLTKLGFLKVITSQKGSVGRPTTRYQYVP